MSAESRFSSPKRTLFVPYSAKIADITHADTADHVLDVKTALGETREVVCALLLAAPIVNAGDFEVKFGTDYVQITEDWGVGMVLCSLSAGILTYRLTVANDDFDLLCFGYFVEVA